MCNPSCNVEMQWHDICGTYWWLRPKRKTLIVISSCVWLKIVSIADKWYCFRWWVGSMLTWWLSNGRQATVAGWDASTWSRSHGRGRDSMLIVGHVSAEMFTTITTPTLSIWHTATTWSYTGPPLMPWSQCSLITSKSCVMAFFTIRCYGVLDMMRYNIRYSIIEVAVEVLDAKLFCVLSYLFLEFRCPLVTTSYLKDSRW